MRFLRSRKRLLVFPVLAFFLVASGIATVALAACGPFSDVASGICPFVLGVYYLGITAGTTSTTYSPAANVTRGQMAVFMSALFREITSTQNSVRVGRRQFGSPFRANPFNNFATVNSNDPVGMVTEGDSLNFISNFSNNIIDGIYRGYSHSLWSSFSGSGLSTGYNLVCDNSDLYTAWSTQITKITLNSSTIVAPWVTVPSGAVRLVDSGRYLGVATGSGLSIVDKIAATDNHDVALGVATGVIWDGSYFWVVDNFAGSGLWDQVDLNGTLINNGVLDGLPVGDITFDGQNIWVPTQAGIIDVIATKGGQYNTVVDRIGFQIGGASWTQGITFTGQYIVAGEINTFGCGSNTVALDAFDVQTHGLVDYTGNFPCNTADGGLAWDGQNVWLLGGSDSSVRTE